MHSGDYASRHEPKTTARSVGSAPIANGMHCAHCCTITLLSAGSSITFSACWHAASILHIRYSHLNPSTWPVTAYYAFESCLIECNKLFCLHMLSVLLPILCAHCWLARGGLSCRHACT